VKFTENDLRLAVNHLAFDMFHFRMYAQQYMLSKEHRACYQAMVYSLLLHFFYGSPRADDCLCGTL
jgi:hypothetical protein